MTILDEDKYDRFQRYFDIDIKTIEEAALGGSGVSLSNYYTKTETYSKSEVDTLLGSGGSVDLTNYYTKTQVDTIVSGKADATSLNNYILTSQKNVASGVAGLDNNGRVAAENLGANATATRFLRGDKTWIDIDKTTVGLSNVDNTSDSSKPISSATQTALDGKQALNSDLTAITTLTPTNDDLLQRKAGVWTNRTPAQFKTDLSLTKTDVGLANVDNTSDANKPVSTATQTALDLKAALTVTNALDSRVTVLEGGLVTLTHSATVTPDANAGKSFKWTMTGDATLAVPTNGSEGTRLFIAILASGADRTLTLSGSYRLTTGTSASIVIPNSKSQFIGLRYNGTNWYVIASTQEL